MVKHDGAWWGVMKGGVLDGLPEAHTVQTAGGAIRHSHKGGTGENSPI